MLSITLVCVGRMREPHYIAAFAEYEKALQDIDARLKQLPPPGDGVLRGVGLRLRL